MKVKLLYYSCLLVIGLTAMDAVTITEGFTYGRLAFMIMMVLVAFSPKDLIPSKKNKYLIILALFILYVGLTMSYSVYSDIVLERFFYLIQYYIIIVVVGNVVVTQKQVYNLFFFFCLGTLYIAYMMFFNYTSQSSLNDEVAFRSESVGNPNENAFLLVYSMILSYILIKSKIYSSKLSKLLYFFIILYILAVFSSGSRMGFLIMILVLGSILFAEFKLGIKYLIFVFIGILSLNFLINNYISETTLERLLNTANDIENSNLASREYIWSNAYIMFQSKEFNWIIGNGWATFPYWYQKYFGTFTGSHNFYISSLYTTGLIGGGIIFFYFINLYRKIFKKLFIYHLLLVVPLISMMSTNWEYRRWWFLIGLFIYKIEVLNNKDFNLKLKN